MLKVITLNIPSLCKCLNVYHLAFRSQSFQISDNFLFYMILLRLISSKKYSIDAVHTAVHILGTLRITIPSASFRDIIYCLILRLKFLTFTSQTCSGETAKIETIASHLKPLKICIHSFLPKAVFLQLHQYFGIPIFLVALSAQFKRFTEPFQSRGLEPLFPHCGLQLMYWFRRTIIFNGWTQVILRVGRVIDYAVHSSDTHMHPAI